MERNGSNKKKPSSSKKKSVSTSSKKKKSSSSSVDNGVSSRASAAASSSALAAPVTAPSSPSPLSSPLVSSNLLDILLVLAAFALPILLLVYHVTDDHDRNSIACNAIMSVIAFAAVVQLIPIIQKYTLKRGMSGKDLNKPGAREDKPDVPESQGVVSGVIYVIIIIILSLIYAADKRELLVEYNAALHSIGFMIFLGFADDVVDLPWRYKLILPTIATLPLLVAYNGSTYISVPIPARFLLGSAINLGLFYQVYMGLLAVFCTNAINIFAGINGLEAGQSFVIGCAILTHNLIELPGAFHDNHLFSIYLIVPFLAVTLGLLRYNWYPSHVFVGDTFCYFAGMTFAVAGILGHFSKTLLLFFIPQIINFLYSVPQIFGLFGLVCPRHRLPRYNPATDRLEPIATNHNLLNLWLLIVGPQHEKVLCRQLLIFQAACCALGFLIRYQVASYFY